MSSAKLRQFCLGRNVLICHQLWVVLFSCWFSWVKNTVHMGEPHTIHKCMTSLSGLSLPHDTFTCFRFVLCVCCNYNISVWWIRVNHDDVIQWKHFPRYWPFVRGIHRSPVNSPHKGQWRVALIFSLICAWIDAWVNNRAAGDLRHHRAQYDVIVMYSHICLNVASYAISIQQTHDVINT